MRTQMDYLKHFDLLTTQLRLRHTDNIGITVSNHSGPSILSALQNNLNILTDTTITVTVSSLMAFVAFSSATITSATVATLFLSSPATISSTSSSTSSSSAPSSAAVATKLSTSSSLSNSSSTTTGAVTSFTFSTLSSASGTSTALSTFNAMTHASAQLLSVTLVAAAAVGAVVTASTTFYPLSSSASSSSAAASSSSASTTVTDRATAAAAAAVVAVTTVATSATASVAAVAAAASSMVTTNYDLIESTIYLLNNNNNTETITQSIGTIIVAAVKPELRYSIPQMIILTIIALILSILTVAGNVMVMISFKIDKQLQTISNYFLFSLAIADFAIGLISMPLFAVTTILGYWPLGPYICDTWLALDYLASNASVLNLLIISFDRYFSVTRPLTYRAKRTTSRAAIMIGAAWGVSLLLWPPWIYSWPYIEGKRTVPEYECYIQFIETNHYITFGTAIAAFYVPVSVMIILYYRIWRETKKRQKDLPNLQAGKKDSSKRSNSSDETTAVTHSANNTDMDSGGGGGGGWRRPRSESSADAESVYTTNAILSDSGFTGGRHSRRSSTATSNAYPTNNTAKCLGGIKDWCIAWWHSGQEDSSDDYGYDYGEETSDLGCTSGRTGLMNTLSDGSPTMPLRQAAGVIQSISGGGSGGGSGGRNDISTGGGGGSGGGGVGGVSTGPGGTLGPLNAQLHDHLQGGRDARSLPSANNRLGSRSVSQDSVYTILIRLPPDGGSGDERAPSIKMIQDDVPMPIIHGANNVAAVGANTNATNRRTLSSRDSEYSLPANRRPSHGLQAAITNDIRLSLNTKIIPKSISTKLNNSQVAGGNVATTQHHHHPHPHHQHHNQQQQQTTTTMQRNFNTKKKKKSQEKRQESKAAKTLSAILLSFIITWTPYNILVLLKPLTACTKCIPQELWDFFYALCYINSTINPVCYALCNASFRRTYVRILTCKWHTRNREAISRGVYN